jgi:DNA-binding SARP family transcriptional activator
MADDTGVGIRLLGGFEATVGGRLVAADAWRLRKARTLVKLLVLADGHRMHRESLVALLWPDRDTASGINNLHQALYVARRVLAPGSGVLFPLREDVVLLSDSVMPWLDVEAFEAACRRARETRAPGDYRLAGELYRGDLLPEDQFEAWAEAPLDALRERRLGLLIEYAEVLSERREYTEVAEIAGVVTAADPFHEGAYRLLMTALAARGRRYEALAAFDRLRESLTREFAADPEPATRRLYRDLLTGGDPSPDAAMATESATASSIALPLSRTVATTAMTTGPAVAIRPVPPGPRAWRRRAAWAV